MSNQCSNLSNSRSFSFCSPFLTPLKPCSTTLRPFFPFQRNLILVGRSRRSRSRSSSIHRTLAAQSSSEIVLIATTEHHDGSLVFRFGDASEVVENDVVEEIESETEEESSVVKVVDGDLTEVIDGIRNADIDGAESETDAIRDSRDYHAGSSERSSDISEKEVLLSKSDGKMNNSLSVIENTLDEAKFIVQLDQGESSDPSINLLDSSPNIEKSADPEGTVLKGGDDKTVDPSVYVELESTQVLKTGVMDDLDQVEIENTRISDIKDILPSAFPATAHISNSELAGASNKDVEEELKDMINDDGTLMDELPPSNPLDALLLDAVNEDVEEDLQDMNINDAAMVDEMPSSDQLVVEPTLDEVSKLQSAHVKDQTVEDELQQVSTNNREENNVAYVIPVSPTEEAERFVEEEVIQPQSIPLEFKPTIQVQDIVLQDTADQNPGDGILQVDNEIKDLSVSVKVETIQLSDDEVTDVTQPYTKDESPLVESQDSEDDTKDLLPPATMPVSNVDMGERLQDMNFSEAISIDEMSTSNSLGVEPALDVSSTIGIDVKNVDMDEKLQDMNSEGIFTDEMPTSDPLRAEPSLEVSTEKGTDVQDVDLDESLQDTIISEGTFIDEMPTSDQLGAEQALEVSTAKSMDVKDADLDEKLPDLNISEGTFIDEMSTSDPLGAESALEVSTTKRMDVKDVDLDERLQDTKISEGTFTEEMPTSDLLGAELALEVSTTKGMDVKDVDLDERLQDTKISEGTFTEEMPTSDTLGTEPRLEDSTTEGMDVKDVDVDERLQDMNISEGTIIDEMLTSDPIGAEPALEVSATKGMDVKDVDMDERLQDMNVSEVAFVDEMSTSDQLGAEAALQVSTTKGIDADMDERLQDMNVSEGAFTDEMPASDPLGAEPALEVSTTKGMDVKDVDMDERLQDMNISEVAFVNEMPTSDPLGAETALEVSTTKGMDVDMDERLQDLNVSEGAFIDEMPASDPLGAEPALEVSTTKCMDVKDLAVEDELRLVSNNNMDENEIADVMPAEPILEEEVSKTHITPVEFKATMQVSDTKVQDATCQNLDDKILQVIDEDAGGSYVEDVEQSSHQLESQPVQDERVNHNMLEQHAEADAVESSILLKQGAHDSLLEAERTEGMAGSSELAGASEVTASALAAEAEIVREEIYLADDILISGAALLEHPSKALTGGDDAYFVAGNKWLGVANGVSQWSFEGTDPGAYAQELMRTCGEIVLDTSSVPVTNPVELLCRGVKETNTSGSSSVLIANFNGQALHAANIGDTGFLIIRHGAVFKKSSPLLHEFHFALQVDDSDDPLQLVEEYLIELEVGDVVVSATDGLFDNLYEREITMIVSKALQAGMKPQEIANILATRAQEVGKSAFVRSPFSDAAQAAGYTGYAGGKPDNVAVIVSLVENKSNLLAV